MASLSDVLASVDGLRADTASRIRAQFPTVAALAEAPRADLEEIKGVGQVLSGRLLMAAARAQATATDPDEATRAVKDATAAGMAVATEVVDAAGNVAGKLAKGSETASGMAKDAEIAAKTGVFRAHAQADDAIDKTAAAVRPAADAAKAVADKAMGTAKGIAGKAAAAAGSVTRAAAGRVRKAGDKVATGTEDAGATVDDAAEDAAETIEDAAPDPDHGS